MTNSDPLIQTHWLNFVDMMQLQAVGRNILPEENEVVPQVLQQVITLPQNTHVAVRMSGLRLVGELCEWIERHPDSLDTVLNWLLLGLQTATMSSEAATALQNISSQCRQHMCQHINPLLQILESINSFKLKPDAANGLIKGVVNIISIMEHDQVLWVSLKAFSFRLGNFMDGIHFTLYFAFIFKLGKYKLALNVLKMVSVLSRQNYTIQQLKLCLNSFVMM